MHRLQISKYTPSRGNKIATIRSRVTRRTPCHLFYNIQSRTFKTKLFGDLPMKLSNRDARTIEKNKCFEAYLFNTKNGNLTPETLLLKKRMMSIIAKNLNITNIHRALSHTNAPQTKIRIMNYLENIYTPSVIKL